MEPNQKLNNDKVLI